MQIFLYFCAQILDVTGMKRSICIFLTFLSGMCLYGENLLDSTITILVSCLYQGDPRTLADFPYTKEVRTYDAMGNILSQCQYMYLSLEDGMGWDLTEEMTWEYNTDGKCIAEQRRYKTTDDYPPYELIWVGDYRYTYEYDVDGNIGVKYHYGRDFTNPQNWSLLGKREYTYDNGLLKSELFFGSSFSLYGGIEYEYDSNGNLIREENRSYSKSTSQWTNEKKKIFKYNEDNTLSSIEYYNWEALNESYSFDTEEIFEYINGVVSKVTSYTRSTVDHVSDRYLYLEKFYEYDEQNKLTEEKHIRHNASTKVAMTIDSILYDYDADGDLFRRIEYKENNSYNTLALYTIDYNYYRGKFAPEYFLWAYNGNWITEEEPGIIQGTGIYPYNASVQLFVIPADGCRFVKWKDGNTDNPRTFTMNQNFVAVAYYEEITDALNDARTHKKPNKLIRDGQFRIIIGEKEYNALGTALTK